MIIINKETNKTYVFEETNKTYVFEEPNKIAYDGCHKIYICEDDEDFRRPDLVISNQQFSYNNKLYQLLVIDQPSY